MQRTPFEVGWTFSFVELLDRVMDMRRDFVDTLYTVLVDVHIEVMAVTSCVSSRPAILSGDSELTRRGRLFPSPVSRVAVPPVAVQKI